MLPNRHVAAGGGHQSARGRSESQVEIDQPAHQSVQNAHALAGVINGSSAADQAFNALALANPALLSLQAKATSDAAHFEHLSNVIQRMRSFGLGA